MSGSNGPSRTDHLPPMPDRNTGLPRPPHAPLWPRWVPGAADVNPKHRPQPPPGQGPVLEHFKETRVQTLVSGAIASAIFGVAISLFSGGVGWMTDWVAWLMVLWPIPVFLIVRGLDLVSAGADWVRFNRRWVRTYDLARVSLTPRGAEFYVIMWDREGRKVRIPWRKLCENRALWDLVYNGLLHSAHNGPFTSNREAQRTLKLPR
jgi:hypothetical protein